MIANGALLLNYDGSEERWKKKCIECISLVWLIWFHTMRTSIAINHIRQRVYVQCALCALCVSVKSGIHFNLLGFFPYFYTILFSPLLFLFYFLEMSILLFCKNSHWCRRCCCCCSPSFCSELVWVSFLVLFSCSAHLCFTHSLLLFQLLFICMISLKVILDMKTSVSTFCHSNTVD